MQSKRPKFSPVATTTYPFLTFLFLLMRIIITLVKLKDSDMKKFDTDSRSSLRAIKGSKKYKGYLIIDIICLFSMM